MPSITPIIRLVSLDATANLVAVGLAFMNATVTGATNATPVVLSLSAPHLIANPKATVVVSGVTGNLAANGIYVAHVVDAQTLALYSLTGTGAESPVAGSGAYAGGGTVQTAFTDGEIVVGKIRDGENWAPPRCVFTPRGFRFAARSYGGAMAAQSYASPQGGAVRSYSVQVQGGSYTAPTVIVSVPDLAGGVQAAATAILSAGGSVVRVLPTIAGSGYLNPPTVTISDSTGSGATVVANLGPNPETLLQMQQRSVLTEWHQFDVRVWGVSSPRDYDLDFDATQAVYQQVIASCHRLGVGAVNFLPGVWEDSRPNVPQMSLYGHTATFRVEFATPVLDAGLDRAPVGVRPQATLQVVGQSGSVEVGEGQLL